MQGTGCVVTDLTVHTNPERQETGLNMNKLKFPSDHVLSKLTPEFRTVGEEIHCFASSDLVGRSKLI